jgi:hypothetical protein
MATTTNTVSKSDVKPMPENLKFQRDKDRMPVRGKFIFHEVPGGKMDFVFRAYKGDPIATYSFCDGDIKTIPLGVAKHLNTNCWYPSYKYANDDQGRPAMSVGQKIRRCSFQSLEFLDIEGVAPIGSSISGIEEV